MGASVDVDLDEQEKLIVRELIRNPRISDNQIAIRTNVPLKTVNRKRKQLEDKGVLSYYCQLDNTREGTGLFQGRHFFIIVMREGLTRQVVSERLESSHKAHSFFPKHLVETHLGEFGGRVCIITLIESYRTEDLVEIYNAELVPELEAMFGHGCVKETITIPLASTLRRMRNYLAGKNLAHGIIKEDWANTNIFVQ